MDIYIRQGILSFLTSNYMNNCRISPVVLNPAQGISLFATKLHTAPTMMIILVQPIHFSLTSSFVRTSLSNEWEARSMNL
jgi:hypothetical protein